MFVQVYIGVDINIILRNRIISHVNDTRVKHVQTNLKQAHVHAPSHVLHTDAYSTKNKKCACVILIIIK